MSTRSTRTSSRHRLMVVALTLGLMVASTASAQGTWIVQMADTADPATFTTPTYVLYENDTWCADGMAITGFTQKIPLYLSGVSPICRPLIRSGADLIPDPNTSELIGPVGDMGNSAYIECPAGQVVSGFTPRSGSLLDGFTLLCRGFSGDNLTGVAAPGSLIGTAGGGEGSPVPCPDDGFLTGIKGGLNVDGNPYFTALTIRCSKVSAARDVGPDATINGEGTDVIGLDGVDQTVTKKIAPGKKATFTIGMRNIGLDNDALVISGNGSKKPFTVKVADDVDVDITPQYTTDGWSNEIAAAGGEEITLTVKASKKARKGQKLTRTIELRSELQATAADVVVAKVVVK